MANFLKKRLSRKDDNSRPAQRALSMSSVHEWLLCNPIRGRWRAILRDIGLRLPSVTELFGSRVCWCTSCCNNNPPSHPGIKLLCPSDHISDRVHLEHLLHFLQQHTRLITGCGHHSSAVSASTLPDGTDRIDDSGEISTTLWVKWRCIADYHTIKDHLYLIDVARLFVIPMLDAH